ncbi:MAG: DJ-1/PfpI family protein [Planctomycetaceae bacterium]
MQIRLLIAAIPTLLMSASGLSAEEVAPKSVLNVGVLLFEGVELLDFAGPAEVFIVAGQGDWFQVHTIAASKKPLKTMGGVMVTPSHAYHDAPRLDIVVIPGGAMSNVDENGMKWIRTASDRAKITMSVCMGAFLLAEADLLNGLEVTTHHWGIHSLRRRFPKCGVVEGKRFVDSGKIITTAGVTAGIDGALHIVKRLRGEAAATWVAEEWMEYRLSRSIDRPAVPAPDSIRNRQRQQPAIQPQPNDQSSGGTGDTESAVPGPAEE